MVSGLVKYVKSGAFGEIALPIESPRIVVWPYSCIRGKRRVYAAGRHCPFDSMTHFSELLRTNLSKKP